MKNLLLVLAALCCLELAGCGNAQPNTAVAPPATAITALPATSTVDVAPTRTGSSSQVLPTATSEANTDEATPTAESDWDISDAGDPAAVRTIANSLLALDKVQTGTLTELRMGSNGKSVQYVTKTMEIQLPDRTRSQVEDPSGFVGHYVQIGRDFYTTNNQDLQGKWEKSDAPVPGAQMFTYAITEGQTLMDFLKRIRDAHYAGPGTLDDVPVGIYEYTDDRDSVTHIPIRLWIATSDGLPRRYEYYSNAHNSYDEPPALIQLFSDFNAPIDIEPPETP